MRDLAAQLRGWYWNDRPFALALVVAATPAVPSAPGAVMAVAERSGLPEVLGNLADGWLEAGVVDLAARVLADGVPRMRRYGYADDEALALGPDPAEGSGDALTVHVTRVDAGRWPDFPAVASALLAGQPTVVATRLDTGARAVLRPGRTGPIRLGGRALDARIAASAAGVLASGGCELLPGRVPVFVQGYPPPPRLLVFGSTAVAGAVCRQGRLLGYRVTLCDARGTFTTEERFPEADEIVVAWPDEYLRRELATGRVDARTVVCCLTHQHRFDVPVLALALRSPARYVGAIGTAAVHAERLARLRERGLTDADLARLRRPVAPGGEPPPSAVAYFADVIASQRRTDPGYRRMDPAYQPHARSA